MTTRKVAERASEAGVEVNFVKGNLSADAIAGANGPFDLLLDWGTLDDVQGERRQRMATSMTRLAAPGARCFLYCFYAPRDQLPWLSFSGASRVAPGIEPGEMERLFGSD